MKESTSTEKLPGAGEKFSEIHKRIKGRTVAVFLDYDGTLTRYGFPSRRRDIVGGNATCHKLACIQIYSSRRGRRA